MNTAQQIQESFIESFKHTIESRDEGAIDLAFGIYIDGLRKDRLISDEAFREVGCPVRIDKETRLPFYNIDRETEFLTVQEEDKEENEDYNL